MKYAPNAMPAVFAHHGEALCFNEALNVMADVTDVRAWFDYLHTNPQCLPAHIDQALGLYRWGANDKHSTGVTVPAVFYHRDIDIHDVTIL